MAADKTLGESLREHGVSRRGFLKFCAATASMMALPPTMAPVIAAALEKAKRPSVIWLSFQECTGCTESLTRSHSPTVEDLIFDHISLDYHHTLQAASGDAAEQARAQAMKENLRRLPGGGGRLPARAGLQPGLLDHRRAQQPADPRGDPGRRAAAVVAVGTCAAFGGLPKADPNPTGAVAVQDLVKDKPLINVSGCPPVPMVITGVLAHYLTFGQTPGAGSIRPAAGLLRSVHPRPLLPPPLLRQGPVRRDLRRRGRARRAGACTG